MKKSTVSGSGRAALNGSGKVLQRIQASTAENFPDVVRKCAPDSLATLIAKHPAARELLEERFEAMVMRPDAAPSDVKALDGHPVLGDVVARAVQGQKRATEVGQRTLALLQAATQPVESSGVNVYPFLPPPSQQYESVDPYHDNR
jgi:hypothetical protein